MLHYITKWLIKRDLKKRHIKTDINDKSPTAEFRRVLNTLRENKVMVDTREDGIYIRLAGYESKGQAFSLEWGKVISFDVPKKPTLSERLKTYMASPKFNDDISDWVLEKEQKKIHNDRWIEKVKTKCEGNFDFYIEKVITKYDSKEYIQKEHKFGYEPRETLLWLLWDYCEKYGKKCEDEKYFNTFTSEAYYVGSYVIQLMLGQGSALKIEKIKN